MRVERIFFPNLQHEILFMIGTCKEDNDKVLDLGNPGDLWFHARNQSSCHVLAILSNVDISLLAKKEKQKKMRTIVKKGAEFVKRNTAALRSEKNVEITYTDIQHVKKTQYLGCVSLDPNYQKEIHI